MGAFKGATQYAVAEDIARISGNCGIPINVVESEGSLANFFGVRDRPNTQFGLVPSDILDYIKAHETQSREARLAAQGMRIMLPLYNAEVQVIAPKSIRSLQDLNGRRVGVGNVNAGTNLTSKLIFDILDIKVAERVNRPLDEMIELLRQGEIDALMHVAGAPNPAIADGRLDDRFHIVPITDAVLKASYKPTVIPGGTYSFQPNDVQIVSNKTLLMTYEFGSRKNSYYQNACNAVANLTNLIVNNLDELRSTGHPVWKSVDLTEIPPGWEIGTCVKQGLQPDFKPQCAAQPTAAVSDANQDYLDLIKRQLEN